MRLTEYDKARIRYLRQEEGLSLRAIAKQIGCDHSTVRYVLKPDKWEEHKATTEQWKRDNPEQYLERVNVWRLENADKVILLGAIQRAKDLSVPFDDVDTLLNALGSPPDNCPVCHVTTERGNMDDRSTSPSVDRIIPELGYTVGNVQWLCFRCNQIKKDRPMAYLLERLNK